MGEPNPLSKDLAADVDIVGRRIRSLRAENGLSLRKLAELSGLSVGFLSQVERGLSSIALSSLRNVAGAFGMTLADLFAQAPEVESTPEGLVFTLNRAANHSDRVVSGGRHYEFLSGRVPGLVLEPMLVYIEPGGAREEASAHSGEEFAYVLEGELAYEVDGTTHRLYRGDSLHLRSNTPHTLHNDSDALTVVVSVVTPRMF